MALSDNQQADAAANTHHLPTGERQLILVGVKGFLAG
jgi:hypothetical protein